MSSVLKQHETLADQLADGILTASQPDVWHIGGAAGAGKSSLLRLVSARLASNQLVPIRVTAPSTELDAAPICLAMISNGLHAASLVNGETDGLKDIHRPWNDKLQNVGEWLVQHQDRVVLLVDEPWCWSSVSGDLFVDASNRNIQSLSRWLWNDAPCRRVITGWCQDGKRGEFHTVPRIDNASAILRDASWWGQLATQASELSDLIGRRLTDCTPFRLGLLVSLSGATSVKQVVDEYSDVNSDHRLIAKLLNSIRIEGRFSAIKEAILRLLICRIGLPQQLSDDFLCGLSEFDRDIVRLGLCEGSGTNQQLHPLVRDCLLGDGDWKWLLRNSDSSASSHSRLHDYYASDTGRDAAGSLVAGIEAFYHWAMLGDPAQPIKGNAWFIEQLHAVGRSLSRELRQHEKAAAIFEYAIQIDDGDDYSHHYFAYNLDWSATQSDQVEQHYQRAIELNPTHPWWWSRWITYLVTRGRTPQARHEWVRAVDSLSLTECVDDRNVYSSLHAWVARWCLHWAQLDFADEVLSGIPDSIRSTDVRIEVLNQLLESLREAQDKHAVFPLSIPPEKWWEQFPHLDFQLFNAAGDGLVGWRPARIESVASDSIELVVGEKPSEDGGIPRYAAFEFEWPEFLSAAVGFVDSDVRPGRFVELAFYGQQRTMEIRMHHESVWNEQNRIPLYPDPDRYIRRQLAAE